LKSKGVGKNKSAKKPKWLVPQNVRQLYK
jgi:hypothetical protein